jgi:hypothetical protein
VATEVTSDATPGTTPDTIVAVVAEVRAARDGAVVADEMVAVDVTEGVMDVAMGHRSTEQKVGLKEDQKEDQSMRRAHDQCANTVLVPLGQWDLRVDHVELVVAVVSEIIVGTGNQAHNKMVNTGPPVVVALMEKAQMAMLDIGGTESARRERRGAIAEVLALSLKLLVWGRRHWAKR